jgi:hypothetical protein
MKIRAFDIFDIDATPEEFVTLVKSLSKDEIRRMETLRNDNRQPRARKEAPKEEPKPQQQAVQAELPLQENAFGKPMLLTEKGFRQVHPVDLMNREGKVVKTYPSVTQAAREAGFKHPCKISSAIRHKRTYGGYWYRYSEDGQAE